MLVAYISSTALTLLRILSALQAVQPALALVGGLALVHIGTAWFMKKSVKPSCCTHTSSGTTTATSAAAGAVPADVHYPANLVSTSAVICIRAQQIMQHHTVRLISGGLVASQPYVRLLSSMLQ
jgi:hypothetical protein